MFLAAPQEGRKRFGRGRWHVWRQHPKEVAAGAFRREVDHPDHTPGPAHTQHLVCNPSVVGGEHRTKARCHGIKLRVLEGKRLRVAFDPREIELTKAAIDLSNAALRSIS